MLLLFLKYEMNILLFSVFSGACGLVVNRRTAGSNLGENQDRRSPWEWAFFIDLHILTALRCKMSTWHIGSERIADC